MHAFTYILERAFHCEAMKIFQLKLENSSQIYTNACIYIYFRDSEARGVSEFTTALNSAGIDCLDLFEKEITELIRNFFPRGAIYLMVSKHNESYLLQAESIYWSRSKENCPQFRKIYFDVSSYDDNIWILKQRFQWDFDCVRVLIK